MSNSNEYRVATEEETEKAINLLVDACLLLGWGMSLPNTESTGGMLRYIVIGDPKLISNISVVISEDTPPEEANNNLN